MISIVPLFAAAALLQGLASGFIIKDTKREIDNQLIPNVAPPARRLLRNFVRMAEPLSLARAADGAVVTCTAAGRPAPRVLWLKNGVPVADYEEATNEIRSLASGAVTVRSRLVTPAVTGDVFQCVALAGVEETSLSVMYDADGDSNVADYSEFQPAPIITESYLFVLQDMGTSLTLPCRAASSGHYDVTWFANDKEVYDNPRIRVLPSGDLQINKLEWADMGGYNCTVRDIYGKTSESTFVYPVKPE